MYKFKNTGRTLSDKEYVELIIDEAFNDYFDDFKIYQYDDLLDKMEEMMESDQDVIYIEEDETL